MNSIRLMGGLGNQLFQVASTFTHAKRHNFECGFDLRYTDLPLQGHKAIEYDRNLYYDLPKIKWEDYNLTPYKEKRWEYSPIPARDNLLLRGYFQSPKHFHEYRQEILGLFLNDDVRYGVLNRLKDSYCVELRNSISVHVRRGDYLKLRGFHPLIDTMYYIDAISEIKRERDVNCVLVFSDDIEWCKENLHSPDMRYIDGLRDYESMLLMSLCNHNVIANSSFSWWGSYLNEHEDKIVYAPKRWSGPKAGHAWDDIYLPEMRII